MDWFPPNKVIIQGITEPLAAINTLQIQAYGTEIVAGISPGNGGKQIENIPIFDLVEQVASITEKIDASLIFVPPYQVLDAVKEAIASKIKRIIIFTAHIPPLDTIELIKYAQASNTLILGPGSDGIIVPEQVCLGTLEPQFYQPGEIGLITTSKDISYEVAAELNQVNLGQSIVVSLGNDRIVGSNLSQWLSILQQDSQTKAIVCIGQIIEAAEEIADFYKNCANEKPIISYTVGLKTPQEKIHRDAVAIISNHLSTSISITNQERRILNKLKKLGIKLAKRPSEVAAILLETLHQKVE